MRRKHVVAQTVSLFAVAAALAGCTVDGNAVNDSDPAANAVVDVKSLDTGKYPTEPRKPFGEATGDEVVTYDAQRLSLIHI